MTIYGQCPKEEGSHHQNLSCMSARCYKLYTSSMESTTENNALKDVEATIAKSEEILQAGYNIICSEGERPDITAEWAVRLPAYTLLNIFGTSYFGRYRWFDHNPYPTEKKPSKLLKSIAPAYIEQWETWSNLKSFLDLLSLWQVEWLIKTVGTPLAALQLVVDVADHLLTREQLRHDEKSPIMTALLTSAESLLKWPAHYLTQMHQERNHPLRELRNHASEEWKKHQIQRTYLQKCATTYSETRKTAQALHTELVHLLQNKIAKTATKQFQASDVLLPQISPQSMKYSQKGLSANSPLSEPMTKVILTVRKRTPQDALREDMAKRSKLARHELDLGFRI